MIPSGRLGRVAVATAAAFVVAATAWALLQAVAAPADEHRVGVAGAPAAVSIEVDQGDIDVRAVPGVADVSASARVRGIVAPARAAQAVGDEARLSWSCRLWTTCRADVHARVPAGVRLRVRTAFGDVRVAGPVGDLDVETGSGEVEARGIEGASATVRARSGGAVLAFARQPRDVDVEVTSGDVEIEVPAGPYAIAVETRAGDVILEGVRDEDDARGTITADTTAGDVVVRGR